MQTSPLEPDRLLAAEAARATTGGPRPLPVGEAAAMRDSEAPVALERTLALRSASTLPASAEGRRAETGNDDRPARGGCAVSPAAPS